MAKKKETNTNIDAIIKNIEKKYGDGVHVTFDPKKIVDIEVIPTGLYTLDKALGIGGFPRGRITEIYGTESAAKSTLSLQTIVEAQKMGLNCAFVDAEHAFDAEYAKNLGVDLDKLLIFQPNSGEQGLEICEDLIKTHNLGLVIVDSVPALIPTAEADGVMGSQQIGLQARLISHALRKLTPIASKTKTAVIFINQIRMNIGVMFGNPETTSGGKALKYYTSIRLELRRAAKINKGTDIIGNRVVAKVVKNKLAPPFKKTEFDVYFGEGISKEMDLINFAIDEGVVKKEGITYKLDDEKLGVGLEATKSYLKETPEMMDKIIKKIKCQEKNK